MRRDADLIAFYDQEARAGRRVELGELRTSLQQEFGTLLRDERRARLVDVGAGPGLDAALWRDGFDVVGLDLSHANVERMRARGLLGVTGSLYRLPFRAGTFHALWTMSTLVHVPDLHVDEALAELVRVVEPGAPLGIGTWGGRDFEGVPEVGEIRPYRFFSLRCHERWRDILARHGAVESFEVFDVESPSGWDYQFAVLRTGP